MEGGMPDGEHGPQGEYGPDEEHGPDPWRGLNGNYGRDVGRGLNGERGRDVERGLYEKDEPHGLDGGRGVDVEEGAGTPFPLGAEVAGPGTVRQGSGYSGTTSGGVEVGTGHDPDPYDPPSAGYMGDTTSSDESPAEAIIPIEPEERP